VLVKKKNRKLNSNRRVNHGRLNTQSNPKSLTARFPKDDVNVKYIHDPCIANCP
jgi:hypothetical protein